MTPRESPYDPHARASVINNVGRNEQHEHGSEFAQERFDKITAHGLNPIANDVAMKQALADEAPHWEKVKNSPPPTDDGGIQLPL